MKKLVLFSIFIVILGACATATHPTASATLMSTSGSTATGTVTFTEMSNGDVVVVVKLTGVPPGVHGFHIHEKGDCGDNGNAAGAHFNPTGMQHGAPTAPSHHAGDFGNMTANASGVISERFTTRSVTVSAGANSVVGHAVILHANPDDLTTQPSGNAGPRIACGIVEAK